MTDETPLPKRLSSGTPHAVEVQHARAAADEAGQDCRAASAPGGDAAADLDILRGLVAAYGADGVGRMIDSLKCGPPSGLPAVGVNDAKPDPPFAVPPVLAPLAPLAPALMMGFWMLLGASACIKLAQSLWQLLGWGEWAMSVAVPVGGVVGAAVGAILGLITRPRLLVLLMAVFAGASAGGVAGGVAWGEVGGFGGQFVGGLVGGLAWATWLFVNRGRDRAISDGGSPAAEPDSPLF